MAKQTRITLAEPRQDIDGTPLTEAILREPRAHELWSLGMPWTTINRPDGSVIVVENNETIRSYMDLLVEKPVSKMLIDSMSLTDAMAIREAVIGFFVAARQAIYKSSVTGSSSTPE